MGSKKHKKHKERKSNYDDMNPGSAVDQPPLKLVLKVGSSSTNDSSNFLSSSYSDHQMAVDQINPSGEIFEKTREDPLQSGEHGSSSGKKLKKKKKSKKHHKHSHHHSHHSHHHRHHHRRSSCSHHSKSSAPTSHHIEPSTSNMIEMNSKPNATVPNSSEINQAPQSPQHSRLPACKVVNKQQFQQFLSHLLKIIQRKDTQSFFAWPVTDTIAPGYSKFIAHPMDFSTMKKKIEQGYYEVLDQFKYDIKLICDNAMRFNGPDTVYYKAARKLWHFAKCKVFNKSSIVELSKSYPELTRIQMGLDSSEEVSMEIDSSIVKVGDSLSGRDHEDKDSSRYGQRADMNDQFAESEMDHDETSGDHILESVEKSAKWAADRLTLEKPQASHLSFFRQKEDGTTTLGIIGCPTNEKSITLGNLVGHLNEGLAYLPPYKEPEPNRAKPIESVAASPFSSYLPSLDSNNATLNEEETRLLTSTYGEDDLGLYYSQSLLSFANDNDYVMNMVSSLLDVLTQGKHSSTTNKLKDIQREKKGKEKLKESSKKEKKEEQQNGEIERTEASFDVKPQNGEESYSNQLNTDVSADLGLDVPTDLDNSVQGQLDSQASLVNELHQLNDRRLASSTAPVPPSDDEMNLANLLCKKLTQFISTNATPGDVSDPRAIRKALGVQIKSEQNLL